MSLWPILLASLVGSPHCAAMCGLVAGAAGRRTGSALAYHGSRLAGYLTLGTAAGAVGATVDSVGRLAGATAVATRIAGVAVVAFGVVGILTTLGWRLWPAGRGLHRLASSIAQRGRELPPIRRAALLGLVTALLPCGWLYAFVAAAGSTGQPGRGALAMGVFWIGTVPAVAAAGAFVARLAGPLRARLPLVSAATLIVFGLATALARPSHHHDEAPPAAHDHGHR